MAQRHAKFIGLFPTARAIPEELQIGRADTINAVEAMVVGGQSALLLEERRIWQVKRSPRGDRAGQSV
jgi:hypothetical protein